MVRHARAGRGSPARREQGPRARPARPRGGCSRVLAAAAAPARVGEKTVLDIGTSIGDGAQLGNTSSLYPGQAVPAGARWHGSPAEPTTSDYRAVPPLPSSTARRSVFGTLQLLTLVAVSLPLSLSGLTVLLTEVPWLAALTDTGAPAFTSLAFYGETLLASAALFFGAALGGFLVLATVPRLLRPLVRPDRIYPLHGVHYLAHRVITRSTNRKFYTELFGDSSFIVGYLRAVGYNLRPVVQTGSNFGMAVAHETPFLCSVGRGTVVADGLSMISADYSASSFRVSAVSIGANNFLGNQHRLPGAGPDRRRLPARDEGAGPGRRTGAGGRGPARLARVRDPPLRRPRRRPRAAGGRAAPPPGPQGPAQRGHHRAATAGALAAPVRRAAAGHRCVGPVAPHGAPRPSWRCPWPSCCSQRCTTCSSSGPPTGSRRSPRTAARSTTRCSGATSGPGRSRPRPTSSRSTARRSRTCSGGRSACGSAAACSTTAASSPSARSPRSATAPR